MQDICPKCGSGEVDIMADESGNQGYVCLDCMNTWGKGSRYVKRADWHAK